MSTEAVFGSGYVLVLLGVVVALEIYGRQPTSAWSSRVFAGYRKAVPDAPQPADQSDWPHSEVGRFHGIIALSIAVIAVVLVAAMLVRNHQPAEIAALVAVALPHLLLIRRRVPQLLRQSPPPSA